MDEIIKQTYSQLRELLKQRPFLPLRIVMKNGESFEVRRPDWVFLTLTGIVIGMGMSRHGVPADYRIFSLFQVGTVEPIISATTEAPHGPSEEN